MHAAATGCWRRAGVINITSARAFSISARSFSSAAASTRAAFASPSAPPAPAVTQPTLGDATLALHGGASPRVIGAPVGSSPVLANSFYTHPDAVNFSATELRADSPHFYSRWSNPTCDLLERRLAALEAPTQQHAEKLADSSKQIHPASGTADQQPPASDVACVTFGSGMAAITSLLGWRLQRGDHLLLSSVLYAGVAEWARTELPRRGVDVTAVDTSDLSAVSAALTPNTRHVHVETPANPILKLTDVGALAELTHAAGAMLSVDSTIATPIGQRPLQQGADFVCHSLSKYVCGHGDALGGAVIGSSHLMAELRQSQRILHGGVLSPFSAFLMLRGLESLPARMAAHERGAKAVEAWLSQQSIVRTLMWTGSERHPQHQLAVSQMSAHSGMISFSIHGTREDSVALARLFADRLRVVTYAVSLGAAKSLLFFVDTAAILASSFHMSADEQAEYRRWAGEGVFRLSVGLEEPRDIIADLQQVMREFERTRGAASKS